MALVIGPELAEYFNAYQNTTEVYLLKIAIFSLVTVVDLVYARPVSDRSYGNWLFG